MVGLPAALRARPWLLLLIGLTVGTGCRTRDDTAPAKQVVEAATSKAVVAPTASAKAVAPLATTTKPPRAEASSLDPERLPRLTPAPCREGGTTAFRAAPRDRAEAILDAIRRAWPEREPYVPRTCIGAVRTRCAPDLDGKPGNEVLAEVPHRVLVDGVNDSGAPVRGTCTSKEWAWDQTLLVALTPPAADGGEWTCLGVVGYSVNAAGEGGTTIRIDDFVRLPDGRTGVSARARTPGFTDEHSIVLVPSQEDWFWRTAVTHRVDPGGTR